MKNIASTTCTWSTIATTKQKIIISKFRKNTTKTILRCTPCYDLVRLTLAYSAVWFEISDLPVNKRSIIIEPRHEKTVVFFCKCENKDADQLCGYTTAELISVFVFATRIVQYLYFLNLNFPQRGSIIIIWKMKKKTQDFANALFDQSICCSQKPKTGFL